MYYLIKNENVHTICSEFDVIPWESTPREVENALAYNFLSFVKP